MFGKCSMYSFVFARHSSAKQIPHKYVEQYMMTVMISQCRRLVVRTPRAKKLGKEVT